MIGLDWIITEKLTQTIGFNKVMENEKYRNKYVYVKHTCIYYSTDTFAK